MAKQKPRRAKSAKAQPTPRSMAELIETARRIHARSLETNRLLTELREEIRDARERGDNPSRRT